MEYIDIKLISPVSKTNLDGKYLLIAVKHDKLYKHTINLQNATPKQSLYKCETTIPIKSLVLLFKIDNTTYTLMFMGHATNNKIKLKEIYYKSTNYTDDFDLLSEKFFSNVVYQDGYVMLFGYLANYNTDKYDKHSELKITDNIYKIKLTASPIGGQANRQLIEVLAQYWGVAKSQVEIKSGRNSKSKVLIIYG